MRIEKNRPIPKRRPGPKTTYPFAKMKVNNSFFVKCDKDLQSGHHSIYSASHHYGKRHGKKFTVRKVGGGYRCWRIE